MFSRDMTPMRRIASFALAILCAPSPGRAEAAAPEPPGLQCRRAIRGAERAASVPDHLMAAIARVESGRRDPRTGDAAPWPWTIDAEGQGAVFETKAAAIAAVRALQARGVRSIDVGCMQVNLAQHPDAFASLDDAFDPRANADYAARFLTQLMERYGAWPKATAAYHSATPDIGADYQARVAAAWPAEKQAQLAALGPEHGLEPAAAGPAAAAAPLASGLSSGRVAVFLPPNRTDAARMIPLSSAAPGEAAGGGRTLDSYRASPVVAASRPVRAGG